MTSANNNNQNHNDAADTPVRGDQLDQLLRAWHDENAQSARAMRDRVLARVDEDAAESRYAQPNSKKQATSTGVLARIGFARIASLAAMLALLVTMATLFVKNTEKSAFATGGIAQVPEGGALDALDDDGVAIGPCPLQHTDVAVEISGPFARTVVEQTFANPYPRTIEAVYTFPLSERAAVDRMTMIVRGPAGERIIEGEVKERSLARAIYEEARESGYVASLLEQERPNIFTQSVANIEPGATVVIRIATIETVRRKDGVSSYVFPMVVGPRYVPGAPTSMPTLPEGWSVRQGIVLRGPARVEPAKDAAIAMARLTQLLESAIPVRPTDAATVDRMLAVGDAISFTANYANGSAERGIWSPATGLGELNGRFFYAPSSKDGGTGFATDTNQVPDASRITPMPVPPSERAGHDISVRVTIDTGGAPLANSESKLHAISTKDDAPSKRTISLIDAKTIPNRDFILEWSTKETSIEPSVFTHVAAAGDTSARGGYFSLMIEPPARVAPTEIRPRELVFVLDVSGSMNGFPIEKSKALARKAIAGMRANDTFNVMTFAGATSVLWPEPKPATEENKRAADVFVDGAYGAGGTEMMTAINTALVQEGRSGMKPAKLLDLPADGRAVRVVVDAGKLSRVANGWSMDAGEGRAIRAVVEIAIPASSKGEALIVDGTWETRDGDRVFVAKSARFEDADARTRFVFFLTDGYIGNDQAVVQAVRDNARASRVFSFGIGNSVNRFLLEEMARAGRGVCEIVTLSDDADPVIDRLVRRIDAPVLTDIELAIDPALGIHDVLPGGDHLPDLFDAEPIVLMGRFDRAASGEIVVRGRTAAGAWERRVRVELPAEETKHDVVKSLWARAKVDDLLLPRLGEVEQGTLDPRTKAAVIRLGEAFSIATPYTSFVAVEKSRVTVGGKPMLVSVPVELPDGTNWAGFFGEGGLDALPMQVRDGGVGGVGVSGASSSAVGDFLQRFPAKAVDRGLIDLSTGVELSESVSLYFLDPSSNDGDGAIDALSRARREPGGELTGKRRGAQPIVGAASAPPNMAPKPSAASSSGPAGASPTGAVVNAPVAAPGASTRRFSLAERDHAGETTREQSARPGAPGGRGDEAFGLHGGFGGGGGGGGYGRSTGGLRAGEGGSGGASGEKKLEESAKSKSDGKNQAGAEAARVAEAADPPSKGKADAQATVTETAAAADAGVDVGANADATGAAGTTPLLTEAERDTLVRVLDRRLLVLALASLVGDDEKIPALAKELGCGDGAVFEVAMKVALDAKGAIDPRVLESLRALGVAIEDEVAARGLVIARMPPQALVKAALVAGVKRVEPVMRGE
jgi:hypothetical protein